MAARGQASEGSTHALKASLGDLGEEGLERNPAPLVFAALLAVPLFGPAVSGTNA
jgi:hypothetical protein